MSKAVKTVASIALPIVLSVAAPGLGTAIGTGLGLTAGAGAATVGNAILGAGVGALTGGGLKGAALGALTGGIGANAGDIASSVLGGTQVGDFLGIAPAGIDSAATMGPIASGASPSLSAADNAFLNNAARSANAPIGAATTGGAGGIARALGANINPLTAAASVGNAFSTVKSMDAATEAAKIQAASVDKAIATQAPYNELGTNAAKQIEQIQADPGAYVQNNPFYKSLADDAQQRLLANQASKGKIASGGTADALQTSLLNLGNGLVQQQVGTLQNQVNSGQTAATVTSGAQVGQGNANAAGVVGSANALQTGYQNQIATLLALQNLSKAPSYQPTATARV